MAKASINYYLNKQGHVTDVDYNGGINLGTPENTRKVNFRESNLAKITADYADKLKIMIPNLKRINIQVNQGELK